MCSLIPIHVYYYGSYEMRYLTLIVTNIGGQQNLQNHIVRVDNAKHHILVVPTVCHSFAYKR